MTTALEINGSELMTAESAALLLVYPKKDIERLASERKIIASYINELWFVDVSSLKKFLTSQQDDIASDTNNKKNPTIPKVEVREAAKLSLKRSGRVSEATQVLALLAIVFVLSFSFVLTQTNSFPAALIAQVLSAPELVVEDGAQKDIKEDTKTTPLPTVNFSNESVRVSTFKEVNQGVLLLPQGTQSDSDIRQFFSDEVTIEFDEYGNGHIVRPSDTGMSSEKVPFMVVPIEHK